MRSLFRKKITPVREDRYPIPKNARPVNSKELDSTMEELKTIVFARDFEQTAKIRASSCPSVDGYEIITKGQNGIGSSSCFPHDIPLESYNLRGPRIYFFEGKYYLNNSTGWSNRNHNPNYRAFYEQEGLGLKLD